MINNLYWNITKNINLAVSKIIKKKKKTYQLIHV